MSPNKFWIIRFWDDDDAHSTIGRFIEECDSVDKATARIASIERTENGERSYCIIAPERHHVYEGRIAP